MLSIEQYEETAIDFRSIATMLLADAVVSETENSEDSEFRSLRERFCQPQQDICDLFAYEISESGIDIDVEVKSVEESIKKMILVIDTGLKDFTFEEMWETDKSAAHREVLRCVGHGVSFWDDCDPEDFGQSSRPDVGNFESPYGEVYDVLVKLTNHERESH